MTHVTPLLLVALFCLAFSACALHLPTKIGQFRVQNIPQLNIEANKLALVAYSAFVASTPAIASADDGAANAVLVPLVISLLTIGPFLYYQQYVPKVSSFIMI